jgi:hypothetical protein
MRKQRSIGEMISTVTFFGLALYLVPYSLSLLDEGYEVRGYFGLLGAGCCALGGLRFVIADLVAKWRSE